MRMSTFLFKLAQTCMVLFVAIGILAWFLPGSQAGVLIFFAALGFVTVTVGLIARIWEVPAGWRSRRLYDLFRDFFKL